MIGVTESGSIPPSSAATVGRIPSKRPKTQIASNGGEEDRDAALRVGQQLDVVEAFGGFTSPASSRRWYSASSSRSVP